MMYGDPAAESSRWLVFTRQYGIISVHKRRSGPCDAIKLSCPSWLDLRRYRHLLSLDNIVSPLKCCVTLAFDSFRCTQFGCNTGELLIYHTLAEGKRQVTGFAVRCSFSSSEQEFRWPLPLHDPIRPLTTSFSMHQPSPLPSYILFLPKKSEAY
ncbi:hypothetical protein EVAR_41360_1 [Eumeta japonica]|uniref:Uncharacterized protein n=1 Tax=Eumeta variegata TaxID=151549 RepID=A0A4C1XRV6_EUMVA|nr:hypothetical protein EVAR_41360_1 [Eumeta japonica]